MKKNDLVDFPVSCDALLCTFPFFVKINKTYWKRQKKMDPEEDNWFPNHRSACAWASPDVSYFFSQSQTIMGMWVGILFPPSVELCWVWPMPNDVDLHMKKHIMIQKMGTKKKKTKKKKKRTPPSSIQKDFNQTKRLVFFVSGGCNTSPPQDQKKATPKGGGDGHLFWIVSTSLSLLMWVFFSLSTLDQTVWCAQIRRCVLPISVQTFFFLSWALACRVRPVERRKPKRRRRRREAKGFGKLWWTLKTG